MNAELEKNIIPWSKPNSTLNNQEGTTRTVQGTDKDKTVIRVIEENEADGGVTIVLKERKPFSLY